MAPIQTAFELALALSAQVTTDIGSHVYGGIQTLSQHSGPARHGRGLSMSCLEAFGIYTNGEA